MRRREVITLLGGAAAWPLAARAQQGERMRRVGVLTELAESDPGWRRNFAGFIAGLRETGWTEEQNFRFEFRYVPGGSVDHLRAAATELIALRPDVILAVTSVAARLVAEQTQSIPIVFLLSIDPVAEGLVASVARLAAISLVLPNLISTWEANGCNCSRKSRQRLLPQRSSRARSVHWHLRATAAAQLGTCRRSRTLHGPWVSQ